MWFIQEDVWRGAAGSQPLPALDRPAKLNGCWINATSVVERVACRVHIRAPTIGLRPRGTATETDPQLISDAESAAPEACLFDPSIQRWQFLASSIHGKGPKKHALLCNTQTFSLATDLFVSVATKPSSACRQPPSLQYLVS